MYIHCYVHTYVIPKFHYGTVESFLFLEKNSPVLCTYLSFSLHDTVFGACSIFFILYLVEWAMHVC